MTVTAWAGLMRATIADLLANARARTLQLVAPLTEADLLRQHDPLMSPILWDLGHIAHFEELWLVRQLEAPVRFGEMPGMYNPFEHPRAERGELPLPTLADTLAALEAVRARALERLETVSLDRSLPLLRDGYVYHLVLQHEYQHGETMLQTLQLKTGDPYPAPRGWPVPPGRRPEPAGTMTRFPGGTVQIGTRDPAGYDNERPCHPVRLEPFWIDVTPVCNAEFLDFIEAGGYRNRALWSDPGWEWLSASEIGTPKYWFQEDGGWKTRSMDRVMPLDPDRPVCHVSWYEAEAYATWAGKRLPTEYEWEAAAAFDPATGRSRPYPWGDAAPDRTRATLDQLGFETAPVGSSPANLSPIGCWDMLGNVWEWTASDFTGYPGFRSFPYPEYSEVFFGSAYKVLRGGSWATRPGAIRSSFRNWDYPIRRQIFSCFRCARDA